MEMRFVQNVFAAFAAYAIVFGLGVLVTREPVNKVIYVVGMTITLMFVYLFEIIK